MLGSFSEKGLEAYKEAIQAYSGRVNFSESETYDFARCVRPDGSVYGTRGKCRKGTETSDKPTDSEREKAIGRTGGMVPVKRAPLTPEQASATRSRLKKAENEKANEKANIAKREANAASIADKLGAHKEDVLDLARSRNRELADAIGRGDHEAVERMARNAGEKSDYQKARVNEEKANQAKILKEMLAVSPKEQHPKIKADHKIYAQREVARAKEGAGREHDALESVRLKIVQRERQQQRQR
jgi:hypothetical protein